MGVLTEYEVRHKIPERNVYEYLICDAWTVFHNSITLGVKGERRALEPLADMVDGSLFR
jgi:hypothetical protein